MIKKHSIMSIIIVASVVTTAGCSYIGSPATEDKLVWSISVVGHDENVKEGYRFSGEVYLSGHFNGVEVSGITVAFYDGVKNRFAATDVGTLNDSRINTTFTELLDQRPKYVLLKIESINDERENKGDHSIVGLERREDGEYYAYTAFNPYS